MGCSASKEGATSEPTKVEDVQGSTIEKLTPNSDATDQGTSKSVDYDSKNGVAVDNQSSATAPEIEVQVTPQKNIVPPTGSTQGITNNSPSPSPHVSSVTSSSVVGNGVIENVSDNKTNDEKKKKSEVSQQVNSKEETLSPPPNEKTGNLSSPENRRNLSNLAETPVTKEKTSNEKKTKEISSEKKDDKVNVKQEEVDKKLAQARLIKELAYDNPSLAVDFAEVDGTGNDDDDWFDDFANQSLVSNDDFLKIIPSGKLQFLAIGLLNATVEQANFENKGVNVVNEFPSTTYNVFPDKNLGIGYSCKKGLKPEQPNQDDFFIMKTDEWGLYCVCDGHGPHGQLISDFVVQMMPFFILKDECFTTNPLNALKNSFSKVQSALEQYSKSISRQLDVAMSGTTATVALKRKGKLYIAHVGDSTAVLGKKGPDGKVTGFNLTKDHKPTSPEEEARIIANGGEIRLLEGDIPYRVFIKNHILPGLAMTRAIGDFLGASIGVTSVPEVTEYTIEEGDLFLIISSDGVWEFMQHAEAATIVGDLHKKGAQVASEKLASTSWDRWIREEENVVDDITSIIIWF